MSEQPRPGMAVISADGITVGTVDAQTDTHISVRTDGGDAPNGQIWVPKWMIATVEGETIRLNVIRADLHEAVLSLPPGQQRAFETLGLKVKIGRARGVTASGG
jgi:hypothetical protein